MLACMITVVISSLLFYHLAKAKCRKAIAQKVVMKYILEQCIIIHLFGLGLWSLLRVTSLTINQISDSNMSGAPVVPPCY